MSDRISFVLRIVLLHHPASFGFVFELICFVIYYVMVRFQPVCCHFPSGLFRFRFVGCFVFRPFVSFFVCFRGCFLFIFRLVVSFCFPTSYFFGIRPDLCRFLARFVSFSDRLLFSGPLLFVVPACVCVLFRPVLLFSARFCFVFLCFFCFVPENKHRTEPAGKHKTLTLAMQTVLGFRGFWSFPVAVLLQLAGCLKLAVTLMSADLL